jgi:hypothetical protein
VLNRSDGLIEYLRGTNARFEDGATVCLSVAAVDAPASKIDANVASVEFLDPRAEGDTVPGSGMRATAEDGDRMPFLMKVAGKDVPNLTCTSRSAGKSRII